MQVVQKLTCSFCGSKKYPQSFDSKKLFLKILHELTEDSSPTSTETCTKIAVAALIHMKHQAL